MEHKNLDKAMDSEDKSSETSKPGPATETSAGKGDLRTATILEGRMSQAPGSEAGGNGFPESRRRRDAVDLSARGEPFLWGLGGALALGILLIVGFLVLILWNGIVAFYPKPIRVVTLKSGKIVAGEPTRSEFYPPSAQVMDKLDAASREAIRRNGGLAKRTLYRIGNFDLYNEDYQWVTDFQVQYLSMPLNMFFIERLEWGPFVGTIKKVRLDDVRLKNPAADLERLYDQHERARSRWRKIRDIERSQIGEVNHYLEKGRLALRKVALAQGKDSEAYRRKRAEVAKHTALLKKRYATLAGEAKNLKDLDRKYVLTLADVNGREKQMALSEIVRFYPPNRLGFFGKLRIYFSRWWEFLTGEPREANTEGGVLPAIFGTAAMTILMALAVAPFGVMTALYLREYAKQGRLVSIVRISVNNLAGVPSIVYGVFGLGFFAYTVGATIDQLFYAERLPSPTFGTGGLLWASFTLALLTVPVVIVATEEALSAVPRSMREGSLACGASKWQTIRNIVLPRAMPGIMTGLILAMARGAGEVAPLMLVGVVKLAPELPIDGFAPFVHLERSFMHLGFHIFDVGFQSRNSEAGKPMVFVTTLLLIALIGLMNAAAILVRNRLKRKFAGDHF